MGHNSTSHWQLYGLTAVGQRARAHVCERERQRACECPHFPFPSDCPKGDTAFELESGEKKNNKNTRIWNNNLLAALSTLLSLSFPASFIPVCIFFLLPFQFLTFRTLSGSTCTPDFPTSTVSVLFGTLGEAGIPWGWWCSCYLITFSFSHRHRE